ncbi:MAG: hypothetical protein ACRD7E_16525 [Bryobacteraceae bacterium]
MFLSRRRRGEQKAIMALAHQLLTIVFHLVRDGGIYQELGADHYDRQNKPKVTRKLVERLQRMGYYVTLQPIPASAVATEEAPMIEPARELIRKRGRPCKCAERGIPCTHARANQPEINSSKIPPLPGGADSLSC